MEEGKTNAFLRWINSAEIGQPIDSLKKLSSGSLLLEILYLIDQEYRAEDAKSESNEKGGDLNKVIFYLENFYQQSFASCIDQNEISCYENVLEIGKVLSLLLYCAVQGDNVGLFVEKITNMEEDIQLHLKNVIEAVLKEVECGIINTTFITNVLCQSVSVRELQEWENDEYHSSPITSIASPVLTFNSPIKALMASPQMQSRQSQATICKLYKKLNQLQMKMNSQQHIQAELQHELEEKNEQIEHRDQKISALMKEVSKIRGLEDEIQSLSCSEKELEDVKSECERMKRRVEDLQDYKQQFLKLETEFSEYVSEKNAEKVYFERHLKELESRSREQILNLESSLEEKNIRNNRMKIELLEASSVQTTLREELKKVKDLYRIEMDKVKASLDESRRREEQLCQKKNQEVFHQVARESELKNCFKEKVKSLEVAIDQLQLENLHLHQNIEQLRHDLAEEEKLRKRLECDLDNKQRELKDVVCKHDRLQTEFNLFENESKANEKKLSEERNIISKALQQRQAETTLVKDNMCRKDRELSHLKDINEALKAENSKMLQKKEAEVADLLEEKNKESRLLKEARVSIKQLEDDIRAANDISVNEKSLLKDEINNYLNKFSSKDQQISKLLEENDRFNKDMEEKKVELEKLGALTKEKDEEITLERKRKEELLDRCRNLVADIDQEKRRNVEIMEQCKKMQSSLKASSEEKASLIEQNISLKEEVKQLGILSKECENLRQSLQIFTKEKASLMTEISSLKEKMKLLEPSSREREILQKSLEVSKNEAAFLMTENAALKEKVGQPELLLKECENLQRLGVSGQERVSLGPKISPLKETVEQLEPLSKEYGNLQRFSQVSAEEKASLVKENISLKERVEQLDLLSKKCENLLVLSPIKEHRSLKQKVELIQPNSKDSENLHTSLAVSHQKESLSEENLSLRQENVSLKVENLNLKEKIKQLKTPSTDCENLGVSSEEKVSLTVENISLNEKVGQVESLSKQHECVQITLEKSCEEKTMLEAENKLLREKREEIDLGASHNKEVLDSLLKENKLFKSKLISTASTVTTFRNLLTETRNYYCCEREKMVKIYTDLKDFTEKLVNQHSQCKNDVDKDRSVINHEEKTLQAELGKVKTVYDVKEHQSRINKEKESEIEKLEGKAVFKLKETDNLKEIQEKTKIKRSKQLERAKDSKRQLESREDEVEENSLEEENFKLREHISELKESVSDLEKKLSEEEFISKRLGMEVRSLEAQLVYADRQLRQKLANEEARQKYNEGKDSNSRNVSTQSFVSTDSVVSESNLVEFSGEQKAPDNENENEKRVENSESSPDHLEVKGGLRRRSALYQMKDDNRTGSREKRRSTVGGTFFVVDHFTTQDEPAEFDYDYDWDRILELQRRNAACLPHMRSSYPVETQVHTEQEVREEELKSGHSTSYISRKRVRDNASDTNINVTFQIPYDEQTYHTQTLHISKSDKGVVLDDRTKSKRMVSKYSSIKSTNKDENRPLFTSGSFIEQPTRSYNSERFARRENITFNVDLSPPKKARSTFQRSIHRSFGKSDLSINEGKEAVRNKTTGKLQGVRKFPLPRRPIVLKSDKKPLAPKNTNIA